MSANSTLCMSCPGKASSNFEGDCDTSAESEQVPSQNPYTLQTRSSGGNSVSQKQCCPALPAPPWLPSHLAPSKGLRPLAAAGAAPPPPRSAPSLSANNPAAAPARSLRTAPSREEEGGGGELERGERGELGRGSAMPGAAGPARDVATGTTEPHRAGPRGGDGRALWPR